MKALLNEGNGRLGTVRTALALAERKGTNQERTVTW